MRNRIKELRRQLNLSQEEFGKKIGVTRGVIANIENGRVEPKELTLSMISKTFSVDVDWLKTGEGEMFLSVSDDALDDFAVEFGLTGVAKEFIREFIKFSPDEQTEFLTYLKRLFPGTSEKANK